MIMSSLLPVQLPPSLKTPLQLSRVLSHPAVSQQWYILVLQSSLLM